MSLSVYQVLIPTAVRALKNCSNLLQKIEAHTAERNIDPSVMLNGRLFPDMFPLSRQVQVASDIVKGGAARLAQVEAPSFPDNESSFTELQGRLTRTISFLESLQEAQFNGAEELAITLELRSGTLNFNGRDYLQLFILPNLYFHISTLYAIARSNGVLLGKRDYLGPF